MTIIMYLCTGFSLVFSFLSFVPAFNAAAWAFPLTLIYSLVCFAAAFRLQQKPDRQRLFLFRKLLEYLPFVLFAGFIIRRATELECPFILDLFTVIVWLIVCVLSFFISFKLSDKRVTRIYPKMPAPPAGKKPIHIHLLEWVDALLQAACFVLIFQQFILQLYAIPSESMVPEFMVGDRVAVIKTPSGPKFPLSDVGIPRMRSYGRGDIVVFSNPHYNDTKEARVLSFTHQLVYMLTFTTVNINRDEFGRVKADPLVKRITGIPGEKLMLVDGVLYSRRQGGEFVPVSEDAVWAMWDINSLPRSDRMLVQHLPMSKENFALLESVESKRSDIDLDSAAAEARGLVERFASLKISPDTIYSTPELFSEQQRELVYMFQSNDSITKTLLTTNGGYNWFRDFMTAWINVPPRKNLFDEQSFHIDLLLKLCMGKLIVRNAELLAANSTIEQFATDGIRRSLLAEADTYRFYMAWHDQRNFGEFPAGENDYIPENCFFMMGDNRFNSLDMRHSYTPRLTPIDSEDPYSFVYSSILAPKYVHADKILGTAFFRFWPLSRAGVPH
ncbi:S26 family signal peptidase [Brucepastera parasyntrophica]|uniref:S26 family signal peptidase n=1 Tax=Brucepastera parasyntrophica TaxID=2880008 RepID=UPI00210E1C5F|nr:S26 family signal peptidase [Brucepastera parasyntrophica]ULQ59702.1 S26 family signal peptidase [Brucepastera parasyntrophica]